MLILNENMKISGVELKTLKSEYGTPLYIYDEKMLINSMELYINNFKSSKFNTEVIYASKAFCVKEMVRLVDKCGLGLDVVSMGELYTALSVSFDPKKIYFHGNNKSYEEIYYAISNNVGIIVVDNLMELKNIEIISNELGKEVNIIIRMNVGVEAHTHKYDVTAHVDSKFGVSASSEDFKEMMNLIDKNNLIKFRGFHSHIGSQIFDLNAFKEALKKLFVIASNYKNPLILNIGGGFGVHYTDLDSPIPFDIVSKTLIKYAEELVDEYSLNIDKLVIEPGRSIVAEAGYTLYTIGYLKKTLNKEYYFIDGGMTDNIRPALYQAKYEAVVDGKENDVKDKIITVAGKCCESGDLIIENTLLPDAKTEDLLLVKTTGAYGYSMSSNYNKALTPAVVFVNDGKSKLVCKRQTLEQLIEREI